jgi:HK97 family phage major capsid protein
MDSKTLMSELEAMKADLSATTSKNMDEKLAAVNAAIEEVKNAKPEVTAAELKAVKEELAVTVKAFDHLQTRVKSTSTVKATEVKSFQTLLAENIDNVKDGIEEMAAKKKGSVSFDLKAVTDMTFADNFPTASSTVAYVDPLIHALPSRKIHVRQLIPGGAMGMKSTFDFVKEVAGEGAPATAAEGATKSQFELNLVEVSAKAQWIAGFLKISRNMLDDVTGMTTFLNSRLPELLLRAEDTQLISGNGTGSNLSGILDAGNYTISNTGDNFIEKLVNAIADCEANDRTANGILVNPVDYYQSLLNKTTADEYTLPDSLISFINGQLFLAGVPVYKSTAIAAGTYIVGDWAMGANLISRDPIRVEFFYEDGTNVQQNKVTVRVEERVAFPIYGDTYFFSNFD